jgi:hypothetical protein
LGFLNKVETIIVDIFQEEKMEAQKMSEEKSPEQLFEAREKRISDAIQLRVPDRVPVQLFAGYFPAKYTGITCEAVYYDAEKWWQANRRTILDFAPDSYWVQNASVSGNSLEILGAKQIKWPGHGVSPNSGHQALELEPMKGEDYDAFLSDPSDFIVRTYLPRVWGAAEVFAKLPSLKTLVGGTSLAVFAGQLAKPDFVKALDSLREAAETQSGWQLSTSSFTDEMAKLGFPSYNSSSLMASAPFDTISDNLRGMRGAMMDMYQRPEKLLQACEMLASYRIQTIRPAEQVVGAKGNKRVFMALHRGSDGFMSLKQFETFYWPTLKKVILALVYMGWTPCPFFEGNWDQRLEYLRELPKGKVLCHFAQTDAAKAKEILGGHLCFMRDVPASLMQAGSETEIDGYCRKLIQVSGKDGGFILTATCLDEANPDNVHTMIESVRKYGVY